jgi:hypothetical protein
MGRAFRIFLPSLLLGLALAQAGCDAESRRWVPPQEHKVTIVSDATFVRTSRGDYVDGYLAVYDSEFQRQRMFMVLDIPHYLKGDRLILTGRFTDDSVRRPFGDRGPEEVRVFEVERAAPNVPAAPKIPTLK